jgi:hypothetical protein
MSLVEELCAAADSFAATANPPDIAVVGFWQEALRAAFALAKADRARELRGDRTVPRFNEQGVHPFSAEWGRLQALEQLLPGLSDVREKMKVDDNGEVSELFVSTRVLRLEAREVAEEEYRHEIIDQYKYGWHEGGSSS